MVQMWIDWKCGRAQVDVLELPEDEALLFDAMDQEWGNGPPEEKE